LPYLANDSFCISIYYCFMHLRSFLSSNTPFFSSSTGIPPMPPFLQCLHFSNAFIPPMPPFLQCLHSSNASIPPMSPFLQCPHSSSNVCLLLTFLPSFFSSKALFLLFFHPLSSLLAFLSSCVLPLPSYLFSFLFFFPFFPLFSLLSRLFSFLPSLL
jgi:hypothetical protein